MAVFAHNSFSSFSSSILLAKELQAELDRKSSQLKASMNADVATLRQEVHDKTKVIDSEFKHCNYFFYN